MSKAISDVRRLSVSILLSSTSIIFGSCDSTSMVGRFFIGHARRQYLNHIYDQGHTVKVKRQDFDTAWNRAKNFVATYATLPIVTENDSLIKTKMPFFLWSGSIYYVKAETVNDSIKIISAGCLSGPPPFKSIYNSYILADYIRTGNLPYPDLVSK